MVNRIALSSLVVIGSLVSNASADDIVKTAKKLQESSVTIHANGAQGSGVIIKRGDCHYILTAAHVVARNRQEQQVVENGTRKTKVVFNDALIVTELYQDNESVGQTSLKAEVLRYSNADTGEDIALLRVRKKGVLNGGVEFYTDNETPPVGTRLLHCGSLLGQVGSNSVTTGIVSQLGRVLNNTIYDQSNTGAFPGSSGGGIFRESDGKYVGMLVRGAGETFNLFVPVRRITTWAKRNGVEFIMNPTIAIPSNDDLKKLPLEENGNTAREYRPERDGGDSHDSVKFLIREE